MAGYGTRFACALLCTSLCGVSAAWAAERSSGFSPVVPSSSASLTAYRAYASDQAEMLARMTRVLARDVRNGDVEAAQNDYAMAHRYLERLEPAVSKLDRELDERMNARIERDPARTPAPGFTGFHRIEHDLFASRSTNGLSPIADRLYEDALQLQKAMSTGPMPPDVLVDGATATIVGISARTLAGGSEPYSKTELWDIEANLDGAQEIVAAIRPQVEARDPVLTARVADAFARANERLSQFRAGCGFKSFDELSNADKTSLGDATVSLARELAKLRTMPAID